MPVNKSIEEMAAEKYPSDFVAKIFNEEFTEQINELNAIRQQAYIQAYKDLAMPLCEEIEEDLIILSSIENDLEERTIGRIFVTNGIKRLKEILSNYPK